MKANSKEEMLLALKLTSAGVAIVLFCWWFFGESAQERDARIRKKLDAEDMPYAAKQASYGHPDARIDDMDALRTCQKQIKAISRSPSTAVVPDVGWMKGGVNWRFKWDSRTRPLVLRNGLGLDVPTEGLCVVDEQSGSIVLLVVDGQTIGSTQVHP